MRKFVTSQSKGNRWYKSLFVGLLALTFSFSAQAQQVYEQGITVFATPTVSIIETEVCMNDSVTILFTGRAPFFLDYTPNTLGLPFTFGGSGYPLEYDSTDHNGTNHYKARVKAGQAGFFNFALSSFIDSASCDGLTNPAQTHSILVRPLPPITALVHSTYCDGERYWGYDLGGYPNDYEWTNIGDFIGLQANGTGNIPTFTVIDTTHATLLAKYAILATRDYGTIACYAYDTLLISANPTPSVDPVQNVTVCHNQPLTVNFTGDADHYRWSRVSGDIIPGLDNGLDNINVTAINSGGSVLSAVYEVLPELNYTIGTSACVGNSITFAITIYPDIYMTSSHDTIYIMTGETFSYTATSNLSSVSYQWDNNPAGATISETLFNNSNTIAGHTYRVTMSAGSCTAIDSIVVGVVPPVAINATDQYVYANEGTNTYFGDATFEVVVTTNIISILDTTYILTGATTGTVTGTLIGTEFNSGETNVEVIITVGSNNGARTQVSTNFIVVVIPSSMKLNDEAYCVGEIVPAHILGTDITTYTWTRHGDDIGLTMPGSTSVIPSFTATAAGVDTIYVSTPNGHVLDTLIITIHAIPTVSAVNDVIFCSNHNVAINFSGSATANTVYHYILMNGDVIQGLPISGDDNLTGTAINTTIMPLTAAYQVIPEANGCTGDALYFHITINPALQINAVEDVALCNGTTAPAIHFSGNVNGSTYTWAKTTGDVIPGLAASGTGNMPAFLATNSTSNPLIATYEVEMTNINEGVSCTATYTFDITVYPIPNVTNPSGDISICNGDALNITFNGDADTYSWRKLSGNIIPGLDANGTGNISVTTLSNTGNTPLITLYEVIPAYTFASGICQGVPYTFTITINPTPTLTSHADGDTICSGDLFTYTATSNVPDATFAWSRNAIADINNGIAGNGNTATITEVLTNSSTAAITVLYQYAIDINGCGSDPTSSQVSVVVLPLGEATFAARYNVCADEPEVILDYTTSFASLTYRLLFDIESQDAGFVSITTPTVLPADGIHVALPAGVVAGNYHATIIVDNKNCQTEYSVTIHVYPLPEIVSQPQSLAMLCSGQSQLEFNVEATGENLSYQWFFEGAAIAGATDAIYSVTYDSTMAGTYYVIVMAQCDTLTSNEVTATSNTLIVIEKWTDVLYVDNSGEQFTGYQWYKDGNPVVIDGKSQYYAEEPFLQGTYRVRIYLADGTWIESCDYTIDNSRIIFDNLYPNPAKGGTKITVELYSELSTQSNSTYELYDMLGRRLVAQPFTGNSFTLQAPVTSGSYHLRIINNEVGVINKRFIVK